MQEGQPRDDGSASRGGDRCAEAVELDSAVADRRAEGGAGAADAHGYYADYAGADADNLWAKVTTALKAAGYADACTAFGGNVRGFAKGDDKLATKIDSLGGPLSLSIFDEQGKEPLLHGVCFGKYTAGPPERIK